MEDEINKNKNNLEKKNEKIELINKINENIKNENKIIDNKNNQNEIKEEKTTKNDININKQNSKINESNNSQNQLDYKNKIYKNLFGEIPKNSKEIIEDKKKNNKDNEENKEDKEEKNVQKIEDSVKEKVDNYINLTEDCGIKKKIIKEGEGEHPIKGNDVFIYFISRYNEKIFDQNEKDEPFKFTIGDNKVIKGWDIAVQSMKIGEKSLFIMTSEYTYGDKQVKDWIPPSSNLTFEIDLISIGNNNNSEKCLEDMTYDEKLHWGKLLKSDGVQKFKSGDITNAKECFLKALSFLKSVDINKEEEKEGVELYLTTISNICNCFNKEKEYNSVIEFSTVGLKIKILPKLIYFRAIAYAYTEEFDKANNDLNILSNLLLDNSQSEQNNTENIEQTLKYVKSIINDRKQIYIEKNKMYSRAIFRDYLYHNKPLKYKLLIPPKKINHENYLVFFEIKIGDKNFGKIIFELFKDITPITAENFRCFCLGNNEKLTYKGTYIDKIIKNFVIGGGVLQNNNEKEKCIYGEYFDDENYFYCHCRRGLLTMDNEGKNKNNSKFLITSKDIPWFDGKHVVFGQVIKGMEIIKEIENLETDIDDKPLIKVKIENCGEIIEKEKEEIIEENNKLVEENEKLKKINQQKEEIQKENEKEKKNDKEEIEGNKNEEKKEDKKEDIEEKTEKNIDDKKEDKNEEKKEDIKEEIENNLKEGQKEHKNEEY